ATRRARAAADRAPGRAVAARRRVGFATVVDGGSRDARVGLAAERAFARHALARRTSAELAFARHALARRAIPGAAARGAAARGAAARGSAAVGARELHRRSLQAVRAVPAAR